jgi:hypothetical protein
LAAVAFELDSAQYLDWLGIEIDMSFTSNVTVSLEDGGAGCQYTIAEFATDQYWLDALVNCWGGFDEYSPVSKINVRLRSVGAGVESLLVNEVRF